MKSELSVRLESCRSALFALPVAAVLAACGGGGDQPAGAAEGSSGESADVAFLVESCEASDFSAEACRCLGEQAQSRLEEELIEKLRQAPAEDDPAIEGYYSGEEIRRVVTFIQAASQACGVEEDA